MGLPMLLHPSFKRRDTGVPSLTRGHTAGVKAVQIATCWQTFRVAHGVTAVAGFKVLPIQSG